MRIKIYINKRLDMIKIISQLSHDCKLRLQIFRSNKSPKYSRLLVTFIH